MTDETHLILETIQHQLAWAAEELARLNKPRRTRGYSKWPIMERLLKRETTYRELCNAVGWPTIDVGFHCRQNGADLCKRFRRLPGGKRLMHYRIV